MDNSLKLLVSKLSKAEKDYFSKFSKLFKNTSSNYLILYDFILKKGEIGINEIKKFPENNKFINNLSFEKEKLLDKILLSLVNFNYDNSIRLKIQKNIQFIQILIEKEILKKALKLISSSKKIAYKYEEFDLILVIIGLEESLCFKNCFIEDYEKLNKLNEERTNVIKILENLSKLIKIKAEFQQFQFNENTYKFDLDSFIELYGHSPFILEIEIKSVKAKSIWYYIMYLHSFINQDYFTAISYISEQYKLYKSHTELFVRKEFCQLISNFLYFCSLTKNEELFSTIMYEFSNIKNQSKEETDFIQKIKYFRTLALYHQIKQYDKAELLAFEAEKYIEEKNHSITNVENKLLFFNIFRAFIDSNNYKKANEFHHKYYKTIGYEFNSSMFKLFEFIAHYKLQNYDNLIYSVDSWTKTIRSKRKQFPIEKLLIKFFRSVSNKVTIQDKKKLISNTISQLKELEKSEQKYYINHFFDFAAWFERELEEMNKLSKSRFSIN